MKPFRIDVHAHIGNWPYASSRHDIDTLLKSISRADIELCCVSSAKAITCDMRTGNRELFETIESQERLAGQVVINPHFVSDSVAEIREYANHPKFAGLKLHPSYSGEACDSSGHREIIGAYCDVSRKPVLIHTFDIGQARAVIRLAKDFAPLPFIMAHTGGPDWKETVNEAAEFGNLYFEPASSLPFFDKVGYAVKRAGVERFLFGTDQTLFDPWFSIGMIESAEIGEGVKKRIYRDNALALLNH